MSNFKLSDSTKAVLKNTLQEELRQLQEKMAEIQQDLRFLEGSAVVKTDARKEVSKAPTKVAKRRGTTRGIIFKGAMDQVKQLIRNTQVPISVGELSDELAKIYRVRGINKRKLTSTISVCVKSLINKGEVERTTNDSGKYIYLWKEK